jgi:hypothetical protein
MTPQEINIAIAEHLGWKKKRELEPGWRIWTAPNGNLSGPDNIPNYSGDLNAMHEAEKALTDEEQDRMNDTLWDLMQGRKYLWHAAAIQRAEAFLRTVGKWID